jgi:hypothetical protein
MVQRLSNARQIAPIRLCNILYRFKRVLSSEMDLAENLSIGLLFKGEARRFSKKIRPSLACESPLKISRHLLQLRRYLLRLKNQKQPTAILPFQRCCEFSLRCWQLGGT